jgi:hypothetical protein
MLNTTRNKADAISETAERTTENIEQITSI